MIEFDNRILFVLQACARSEVTMLKSGKTETINVRCSPEDKAAIQKAAAKAGMTVSDYVRACTLTMMCTEFDRHALKALAYGIGDALMEFKQSMRGQRKVVA